MKQLEGERFFEVYNGHPMVNNYGGEDHISTEEMWDLINIHYLTNNKPPMYGIATDDSHNYHLFGAQFSNTGRGWVMVNSVELTPEALIKAMENGQFYSTTGVEISNYTIGKSALSFDIDAEDGVMYVVEFVGVKKGSLSPEVLASQEGINARYEFTGDELFVRARITSNKLKVDPYQVGDVEMAWTQPIVFNQ